MQQKESLTADAKMRNGLSKEFKQQEADRAGVYLNQAVAITCTLWGFDNQTEESFIQAARQAFAQIRKFETGMEQNP